MRRLFVLVVLLAGCEADTLPVNLRDGLDTTENRTLIEDAAALWGLGVDWRSRRRGAVHITIHPNTIPLHGEWEGLDLHGEALDKEGCTRGLWSVDRAEGIGHELGHVFGIKHDDEGLMVDYPEDDAEPSDWQRDVLQRRVARWRRRCP